MTQHKKEEKDEGKKERGKKIIGKKKEKGIRKKRQARERIKKREI